MPPRRILRKWVTRALALESVGQDPFRAFPRRHEQRARRAAALFKGATALRFAPYHREDAALGIRLACFAARLPGGDYARSCEDLGLVREPRAAFEATWAPGPEGTSLAADPASVGDWLRFVAGWGIGRSEGWSRRLIVQWRALNVVCHVAPVVPRRRFYLFAQTNVTGGTYRRSASLDHYVIIEASSGDDANARLDPLIASCDDHCPCCGDRWVRKYRGENDDATRVPCVHGRQVAVLHATQQADDDVVVHYLDGSRRYGRATGWR